MVDLYNISRYPPHMLTKYRLLAVLQNLLTDTLFNFDPFKSLFRGAFVHIFI